VTLTPTTKEGWGDRQGKRANSDILERKFEQPYH
jgi:hypothetical protein